MLKKLFEQDIRQDDVLFLKKHGQIWNSAIALWESLEAF